VSTSTERKQILREVVRSLEAIDVGAYETALVILTDLAEDLLDKEPHAFYSPGPINDQPATPTTTLKICGRSVGSDGENTSPQKND
jgi:hypothetical protein